MSAENPEQGEGGDLRARYLPVSRKELRRRREAELAAQQSESQSEEGGQDGDSVGTAAEEPAAPAGPVAASEVVEDHTPTASTPVVTREDRQEAEPTETGGSEAGDSETGDSEPGDSETEASPGDVGAADDESAAEVTDVTLPAVRDEDPTPGGVSADPEAEGPEQTSDPHGAAQEVDLDAAETGRLEVVPDAEEDVPEGEPSDEELDSVVLAEPGSDGQEAAAEDEETGGDASGDDASGDDDAARAEPDAEGDPDEEAAPVPASRRARRLLRETGSLEALTDDKLEEIDQLTAEIATHSAQDPHRVDPELLKKQQALAAKAMQANQERRRREIEQEERDRRRRRRERPESEVITRKALRAYASSDDQDYVDVPTGEIDPIDASGAHGLELDIMVEQTTRQASRQALLLWLVIILAVLLLIAVGVVLFTVL